MSATKTLERSAHGTRGSVAARLILRLGIFFFTALTAGCPPPNPSGPKLTVTEPWAVCNGRVVSLYADPHNCGACGNDCVVNGDPLAICLQGACADLERCPGDVPGEPPTRLICGEAPQLACVDILTDPKNCGDCSIACTLPNESGVCADGTCVCKTGYMDCDKNPVDHCKVNTLSDPNNCGGCGNICNPGESCLNGTCKCGTGDACGPNETCENGTCKCGSGPGCQGRRCCSGQCVDLGNDMNNCGSCGTVCSAKGGGGIAECWHSTCAIAACNDGLTNCGYALGCWDITSDRNHCGSCSGACGSGYNCSNSHCCPIGQTWCVKPGVSGCFSDCSGSGSPTPPACSNPPKASFPNDPSSCRPQSYTVPPGQHCCPGFNCLYGECVPCSNTTCSAKTPCCEDSNKVCSYDPSSSTSYSCQPPLPTSCIQRGLVCPMTGGQQCCTPGDECLPGGACTATCTPQFGQCEPGVPCCGTNACLSDNICG